MPEYKNISRVDLQMDTPNGPGFLVKPEATFVGSDYYMRYTAEGGASQQMTQLEVVSGTANDYAVPYNVDSYDGVNTFRAYTITLTANLDDNILDFIADLGKEATYVRIDGTATIRINGSTDSVLEVTDFEFPANRISIATLALSGSGTASVLVGTAIK